MKRTRVWKTAFALFLYAMAMGYLETVVVIYLRKLYYPAGFHFPLVLLPGNVVFIEYLRELATLIMLAAIGYLAGKNFSGRFGWFLFSFGFWDIFYYLFLKWLLGWPESLLTWDILFLIPVIWTAPVLAPLICAVTMIFYGLMLNLKQRYRHASRLNRNEWTFLLSGAFIIFITFIRDYAALCIRYLLHAEEKTMHGRDLITAITHYVPQHFYWIPFLSGEVLILLSLFLWVVRAQHRKE